MLDTGRKYSCLPNASCVFILYFYHSGDDAQVLFGADVTVLNQLYKTFCLLCSLHTTLLWFTQWTLVDSLDIFHEMSCEIKENTRHSHFVSESGAV